MIMTISELIIWEGAFLTMKESDRGGTFSLNFNIMNFKLYFHLFYFCSC